MKGKRAAYEQIYGSEVPPLHVHAESSVRIFSIRIYLHENDDDPDACCQVFLYGGRAIMFSIQGAGFYMAWPDIVAQLKMYGATVVEGYVVPAHARLLRVVAEKNGTECQVEAVEDAFGRTMSWVRVPIGGQTADKTGPMPKVTL